MANSKKVKQNRIEKKYERLINGLIQSMQDNTMQELWVELDKLKAQMHEELKKAGLIES